MQIVVVTRSHSIYKPTTRKAMFQIVTNYIITKQTIKKITQEQTETKQNKRVSNDNDNVNVNVNDNVNVSVYVIMRVCI